MFILEGTIGAGKSTFLSLLKRWFPPVTTLQEPVQNWGNDKESLLARFIQDPHRWAYAMETYTMICRVKDHRQYQALPDPYLLLERSIYSGHYVFAVNDYKQGFLTHQEWDAYMTYVNYLIPELCRPPLGFIYLRAEPEIAYQRICKRSRSSESGYALGYLQQIHERHEEFLVHKTDVGDNIKNVPVLVLDANHEFESDDVKSKQLCSQAMQFMFELVAHTPTPQPTTRDQQTC